MPFYCTARDADRTAFLLGPFTEEADCRLWAYSDQIDGGSALHYALVEEACRVDPRAWFYGWGMARVTDSLHIGKLNHIFGQQARAFHPDGRETIEYTGRYLCQK